MRSICHKVAVAAACGLFLVSPHSAHATLSLTAQGTSLGFSLSNFISGEGNYDALGSANLSDGTLAVGSFNFGAIYKFKDVDNQTFADALSVVPFSNEIDMANAGGKAYAASRSLGFFEVSDTLTLSPIITSPEITPTQGLAGNPINGNLLAMASSATLSDALFNLNPATGNNTLVSNPPSLGDGVSVSPDGKTAYVAIFGGGAVIGYDIATGNVVLDAEGLPGGPDGTAVIVGGPLNGDIVVNNNDGSVGLLDINTLAETIIALGGSRGDFASPDLSNGSLFVFESDSAWRLSCSGCSIGGGPAPVPLPATLPLLASGLAGLGWLSRRRKRAEISALMAGTIGMSLAA